MPQIEYKKSEYIIESPIPVDQYKAFVYEILDNLSEDRKIEGMVTIKSLVDNGTSWEWIHRACNDPYIDLENKGFNIFYNHKFVARIDRDIELNKISMSEPEDVKNKLTDYLFWDIDWDEYNKYHKKSEESAF